MTKRKLYRLLFEMMTTSPVRLKCFVKDSCLTKDELMRLREENLKYLRQWTEILWREYENIKSLSKGK